MLLLAAVFTSGFAAMADPPPADAPALVENPLGPLPVDTPEHEAYAHGHYWLFLAWNLFTLGFLWALLQSRFASRVQTWAGRLTRRTNLRVMACVAVYSATLWLVSLPLAIATGYLREKRYGFMNQDFAGWLGDRGKGFLVSLVVRLLLVTLLYLLMRRLGRGWWVPGAALTLGCTILGIVIAPVFIDPLFNTFTPLRDQALRADILDLAHRQGIPAHEVYEMDASVQSEHNNAYVTGLFHTQRIVLYDTLLKRFAPREIRAVMGHEMGHYVLHHIWKTVAFLVPMILLGFLLVDRAARRLIASHPRWDIRRIEDPASVPVVAFVALLYLLAVGPAIATFSRHQESEADRFGLEVTRDPQAMASSFIKFGRYDLSEYEAHPLIELLLFSHPSVNNRVRQAQAWARAHPGHASGQP
ncbi:MAG TPA: M48 family metallopeptidase [Verrucomicrobiae bacterium]|nr:M48 family metallopeptidase [Verrucomicrobiae bacterium]